MAYKTYLPVMPAVPDPSIVVDISEGAVFMGDNVNEHTACGACKRVFGKNISPGELLSGPYRDVKMPLVLKCTCGAHIRLRK